MKRRMLEPGDRVIIIYDTAAGFIEEPSEFLRYETVTINDVSHQTPVFRYFNKEINGLTCFWVLPKDLVGRTTIQRLQRELIALQIKALEMAEKLQYQIPLKIRDIKFKEAAMPSRVTEKLGFDPRDESWLETELAVTDREKRWFNFERTNSLTFYKLVYNNAWQDLANLFNSKYRENISVEQSKAISVKRMRYIFGSTPLRMSGNADKEAWKSAAREFEEKHRRIDERMTGWCESRRGKFPTVRTKKDIPFFPGPYFNQCIERIPHFFTDHNCHKVKAGTTLRIIAFDPVTKYMKLDFPEEIRRMLKPHEKTDKPWVCDGADCAFLLGRTEIEECIEIIDNF